MRVTVPSEDLKEKMLKEFGPLMGGEPLRRALGFKTWAAFARAVRSSAAGIPVFEIPSRRGRFALTTDVAEWLIGLRENASSAVARSLENPESREEKV